MIRITLRIRAAMVPCIAKCCPRERTSAVDEDFIRKWGVAHHPTPRMRLETRGRLWCPLDVVDVEKVGSTKTTLRLPICRLTDQRVNLTLGVEALSSLGLMGNTGKFPAPFHWLHLGKDTLTHSLQVRDLIPQTQAMPRPTAACCFVLVSGQGD